ncbi:MAG: hypothetical protein ACRECH_16120 [Nitrososphaerales archaeon]
MSKSRNEVLARYKSLMARKKRHKIGDEDALVLDIRMVVLEEILWWME